MKGKALIYGVALRAILIGVAYYLKLPLSLSAGTIGLLLGFAGGFYIDKGRAERDLSDNIGAGLVVSALLRFADTYYGVSVLAPSGRKLAITALSLIAILTSALSESTRGVPARIPLLGIIAFILAFVLLFSAVTTHPVSTQTWYSGGTIDVNLGYRGFAAVVKYYNTTSATDTFQRFSVPNATSYTIAYSLSGYDKLRYTYVPIRTNRSDIDLAPGDVIRIHLVFSQNVTIPTVQLLYDMPDGSVIVSNEFLSNDYSNTTDELRVNCTISNTVKVSIAVYVIIDRTKNSATNFPNTPITITIEWGKIAEKQVSIFYLGAIAALEVIAIIDALPTDSNIPLRRSRRRR